MWLNRGDVPGVKRRFLEGSTQTILPGVTAIKTGEFTQATMIFLFGQSDLCDKLGGHFDGSLVLHWENHLFIADSMATVPVIPLFLFLSLFSLR
jgi:hypothetical protein